MPKKAKIVDMRAKIDEIFVPFETCEHIVADSVMSMALCVRWTVRSLHYPLVWQTDPKGVSMMLHFGADPAKSAAGAIFIGATNPKDMLSVAKYRWFPKHPTAPAHQPEHVKIIDDIILHAHGMWSAMLNAVASVAGIASDGRLSLCTDLAQDIGSDGREAVSKMVLEYKAEKQPTLH